MLTSVQVSQLSDTDRIAEGIKRAVERLASALQAQLASLLTPGALASAAGFFVAWLVAHAFGVGFVVDALFMGVGLFSIGLSAFSGIDELIDFGHGALRARTEEDLNDAAAHLALAVSILGVQAIVGLLLKRAPRTYRIRQPMAPPPNPNAFRLTPSFRAVRTMDPGRGVTSWWGDITISRLGTATDRRLAALHEAFHRLLMPRLNILRQVRVEGRVASYHGSALARYLEEAIAETYAQVSVNGLQNVVQGITFPVKYGYVTLLNRVVVNNRTLLPVAPEVTGMFLGVANARGWMWNVYHSLVPPEQPR